MTYYKQNLEDDVAWLEDPHDAKEIRAMIRRAIKVSGGKVEE